MDIDGNITAQRIARASMRELARRVRPGMSEKEIEDLMTQLMTENGSDGWWYHGVHAMVLLGERSTESMGGLDYRASETNLLGENGVLTVDCTPTWRGAWGDYARTLFMENGRIAPEDAPSQPENRRGLAAELALHAELVETFDPEETFESVYFRMNRRIREMGFRNLDFRGNLGHTVETDEKDRIYLEEGNRLTFREVGKPFTFEPHITPLEGGCGFKRENIYYVNADRLHWL